MCIPSTVAAYIKELQGPGHGVLKNGGRPGGGATDGKSMRAHGPTGLYESPRGNDAASMKWSGFRFKERKLSSNR
jgi:hypothetical protein